MIKRSFVYYLLLLIILMNMDFNMIHEYRLDHLRSIYYIGHLRSIDKEAGPKKDTLAGILYFDYQRRLNAK